MYKSTPALAPVLFIPGMIYRAGVYLRNRVFDSGLISARCLPQLTLSVGNLSMGGTGKTPFVIYLAGLVEEMGYTAAVLTRGYGRHEPGKTVIMPPGETSILDFSASQLGDEPALIRRRLPKAWLGISNDRFYAANAIERQIEPARAARLVFILDDGFQRRDICRDLDIVMIDSSQPPDVERLFPLGALREPVAELRRADIVIINSPATADTTGTQNSSVVTTRENLRKYAPEADFFHCVQRICKIIPFSDWIDYQQPSHLREPAGIMPKTAFLAAAIGNPNRFKRDIQSLGIETRGCAFFKDHAVIGKKDWETCVGAARKLNAEAIIITEKDTVKISSRPDFPLLVAVQNTELLKAERFREILQSRLHCVPLCYGHGSARHGSAGVPPA